MQHIEKFHILSENRGQQLDYELEPILINMDHLISVKPIKIMIGDEVIQGYWIRTSNGKKYRAITIPESLKKQLEGEEKKIISTDVDGSTLGLPIQH